MDVSLGFASVDGQTSADEMEKGRRTWNEVLTELMAETLDE